MKALLQAPLFRLVVLLVVGGALIGAAAWWRIHRRTWGRPDVAAMEEVFEDVIRMRRSLAESMRHGGGPERMMAMLEQFAEAIDRQPRAGCPPEFVDELQRLRNAALRGRDALRRERWEEYSEAIALLNEAAGELGNVLQDYAGAQVVDLEEVRGLAPPSFSATVQRKGLSPLARIASDGTVAELWRFAPDGDGLTAVWLLKGGDRPLDGARPLADRPGVLRSNGRSLQADRFAFPGWVRIGDEEVPAPRDGVLVQQWFPRPESLRGPVSLRLSVRLFFPGGTSGEASFSAGGLAIPPAGEPRSAIRLRGAPFSRRSLRSPGTPSRS